MATRNKSKAELEAEIRFIKRSRIAEGVIQVSNNLIKYGALVWIFHEIYLMIESLSGKTTLADIGVSFLGNLKISVAVAWVSCIVGIIYGLKQKKLRKDTVERLQTRITELERELDVKRSSSNLTKRGDTRPEDRI